MKKAFTRNKNPLSFLNAVIGNLSLRKQQDPRYRLSGMTRESDSGMVPCFIYGRNGFTLIELLVVVLIIGILAAIALPQYQKAVMRTRYTTLKSLVRSIANAEEVYYLANDKYSVDFEELDVQMPGGQLEKSTASNYQYDWGVCFIADTENASEANCTNTLVNVGYKIRFIHSKKNPGKQLCIAYGSRDANTLQAQICKAETGGTTPSVTSTDEENPYTSYWYPN